MGANSTGHRGDRGAVTAEFAVVLPAAVLVVAGALYAGASAAQQVRVEEAAAAAVRQLARGEASDAAASTVERMAGTGAQLSTDRSAGWVTVRVTKAPPGPVGWWGDWMLEAEAHAPDQWVVRP